ncbi:helix-turn-helix domain-containing protein [Dehalobacterium formicoaceticum]|uniref:helix-turn-helix domain-containing protein n=1 Tax=Dehalobacterium formicoaceticum TaxID=51515 RepID=UPI0012F7B5EC|nr:helix-turn-helix domain-containing protein [Dehalobacterium formicoaceticum]
MSPILTTKEACAYMKCGKKFLYDEVKAGRIRARICGHGYRFHKAELERYVISGAFIREFYLKGGEAND